MNKSKGIWFGVILILLGVFMMLDNMYVLDFWDTLHTYWPVLLIIWGLSMLGRRSVPSPAFSDQDHGRIDGATATVFPGTDAAFLSSSTVFGDYTISVQSKSFTGGRVSNTFGNTDIDLLNAQLEQGENSLQLDGVFGNTTVHLPKDMAFAIYANTTFGGIRINDQRKEGISSSLDYSSPDFSTAARKIRISISRVFGDVRVHS